MKTSVRSKTAVLTAAAVMVPLVSYAVAFTALTGARWDIILRDGDYPELPAWVDFSNGSDPAFVEYSDMGFVECSEIELQNCIGFYSSTEFWWGP